MIDILIRLLRKNHRFIYRWQINLFPVAFNLFPVACCLLAIIGASIIIGKLPDVELDYPLWAGYALLWIGLLLLILGLIDTLYNILVPFLRKRRKVTIQDRLAEVERESLL